MTQSQKTAAAISWVLIGISICSWVLLLVNPGNIMGVNHCHISDSGPSAASLQMLLDMNPISSLMTGWGLMVVAMMLPKLAIPIQHIYAQSFKRLQFGLSVLFVLGYIAVWMAVGLIMVAAMLGLHLVLPNSYIPAIILGVMTIVWQFSPIKQRFLNRGHDHWTLAAFGWPAGRDALQFGVMHGVWCVGAGWALMLLPMILPQGHNLAMIVVTFIMISEHMEHPQAPRWQINFRIKLFRIIAAQTRIRVKQALG